MKRRPQFAWLIVLLCVIVGAVGGMIFARAHRASTLPPQYYAPRTTAASTLPKFDHVVVLVEENHSLANVIGNSAAPYLNQLANTYTLATNYYSTAHPSLPNYLELTSGTNAGITSDCNPPSSSCQADVRNLADSLEAAGRSWKAYLGSMPAPCTTHNAGRYATKHNPFVYYPDIRGNAARCTSHVGPFSELRADIAANHLPDYAFIAPDLCDDMHDCSVSTGDQWLAGNIPALLNSPAFTHQNSLLAIVWDEGSSESNHVPAIFVGSHVKRHYTTAAYYSHYSLLHALEAAWNLPTLTANDKSAPVISGIFQ